jgi:hypothetical protein
MLQAINNILPQIINIPKCLQHCHAAKVRATLLDNSLFLQLSDVDHTLENNDSDSICNIFSSSSAEVENNILEAIVALTCGT